MLCHAQFLSHGAALVLTDVSWGGRGDILYREAVGSLKHVWGHSTMVPQDFSFSRCISGGFTWF